MASAKADARRLSPAFVPAAILIGAATLALSAWWLAAVFAGLDVVAGRVLRGAAVDVLPDVVKVVALAQRRDYRQR